MAAYGPHIRLILKDGDYSFDGVLFPDTVAVSKGKNFSFRHSDGFRQCMFLADVDLEVDKLDLRVSAKFFFKNICSTIVAGVIDYKNLTVLVCLS